MDGIIEQKSVLAHSKISDAGKRNGLINTRNFMAESRDGLVSVYPAPQYQNHRVVAGAAPATLDSSRNEPVQQLLDPNTLQQSVESHFRPNIILYSEGVLRSWGDGMASDCCETTFIEDRSPTKESLEYPDGKFIDLSADDIKIHTLSYDVEEEEEFQELEVRGYVCHRPLGMGSANTGTRLDQHQYLLTPAEEEQSQRAENLSVQTSSRSPLSVTRRRLYILAQDEGEPHGA
ncbi:Synapse differentiation-inducing gene protein 1 [Galemys pyrenaicus]|uniref:Synapse differentiation-inducing gene protein 1 n=1 Tax=Galemys pyrenaicus TaxID=202257 RepID=A0A8J5ZWD5_GALPY|nr:Synapse differentiation-inducing gene protein 1 [Galemys pyrenaicus]